MSVSACLERDLSPVVPCVSRGFVASIQQAETDQVDLLFVVDDSPSMIEEQASLAQQIPHLVRVLTSGDKDGDGVRDFTPPKSLHAAVVSVNMGVGGQPNVPTCMRNADFGDDGVFLSVPRVGGVGCAASYPHYLDFELDAGGSPDTFATDFTCLARTGIMGCAYEQQLDSPLKALLPSSSPITFYAGTHGHGDDPATNGGFLREHSLVVVIDITDEDDCSTDQTDIWNQSSTTHTGNPNLRCVNYDAGLYPVQRFVDGLRSLRPGAPGLVLFATITGVPPDLVQLDATHRTIDYDRLFADPRMQNTIIHDELQPACSSPGHGLAYPGIRMSRMAQAFGDYGIVQSICQDDFGPALDVILDRIVLALDNVCLPRALVPDSEGRVGCDVVEIFRPSTDGTGLTSCGEIPGADPTPTRTDADGLHCRVQELPVDAAMRAAHAVPTGTGWYYDDYTDATLRSCAARAEPQRIAFTREATPPAGVTVRLECLQRVAPATGARGACATDADCARPLICDTSMPTPACVNPSCG